MESDRRIFGLKCVASNENFFRVRKDSKVDENSTCVSNFSLGEYRHRRCELQLQLGAASLTFQNFFVVSFPLTFSTTSRSESKIRAILHIPSVMLNHLCVTTVSWLIINDES